jgi:hypothetical protein
MERINVNADYCGIIVLLRQLIKSGACSEMEAKKIAKRIAVQDGVDIILNI